MSARTTNEIIVLFDGYSRMIGNSDDKMEANCTCTLIRERTGLNIIVDTMDCWSGPQLLEALKSHNISPNDINFCISTHSHCDHLGNNNLFLNARHIVGEIISQRDQYYFHNFQKAPFRISDDIEVISSRGHTLTCVTVMIRNSNLGGKTVAIVGDLFEKLEDIDDPSLWRTAGSESPEDQERNRSKVADQVDGIVPGHGPIFEVTEEMRKKLRNQIG